MSTLNPQLALRIGLAAQALSMAPANLMPVLITALRMPLTDQKLKSLTLAQLRDAGRGALGNRPKAALDKALLFLWDRVGVDIIDPATPPARPYREGDLPGSIRVAVASNTGAWVDGDCGHCPRFLIYQVSPREGWLIDVRGTAGEKAAAKRLAWRAALIGDCHLVLARTVSTRAAAPLVHRNCYPVSYPQPITAADAIDELRRMLLQGPPPWLAKHMGQRAELAFA